MACVNDVHRVCIAVIGDGIHRQHALALYVGIDDMHMCISPILYFKQVNFFGDISITIANQKSKGLTENTKLLHSRYSIENNDIFHHGENR